MKISIVTPSYNQVEYLHATLESVLQQPGPTEYIVVDAGSTDGSAELIASQGHRLAWWCSEPDGGQYKGINKGFAHTTGDIMGWLNSSDLYLPWTFQVVREVFTKFPEVEWITSTTRTCIRGAHEFTGTDKVAGYSCRAFWEGRHGSRTNTAFIQQESTFWRRSLWDKIGGAIPDTYPYAGDFHLWAQFFQHAPLVGVNIGLPLAIYRYHDDQRGGQAVYYDEVEHLLAQGPPSGEVPEFHSQVHVINNTYGTQLDGKDSKRSLQLDVFASDDVIRDEAGLPEANRRLIATNVELTKAANHQDAMLKEMSAEINRLLAENAKSTAQQSLLEAQLTQATAEIHRQKAEVERQKNKRWLSRMFKRQA